MRRDRLGETLYRIATQILGHDLPPYVSLNRAEDWRGAWSFHEVRKDVATIVGHLMGEWTRACELTSDTKDTLMSEYLEREFHPMGKAGEWQCVETYYPHVRKLLHASRHAGCPLDDPTMPLPPGARALLDEWKAADSAAQINGRRSRHGVADARTRGLRPDLSARNRRKTAG